MSLTSIWFQRALDRPEVNHVAFVNVRSSFDRMSRFCDLDRKMYSIARLLRAHPASTMITYGVYPAAGSIVCKKCDTLWNDLILYSPECINYLWKDKKRIVDMGER